MYQPITRIFDGKTFYQIPGFVDYWISADDEVISDKGRTHYLKVHFGYHGYYRVHLQHSDHKTFPNLHRLKIMAMITGPLRFDQKVDHIDGNPRNNCLENLQVLDNTENMRKCPFTVLTEADATQIWDLLRLTPLSAREIGEAYGVSRGTIEAIRYGRSWNSVTGLASAKRIHRPEAQRKTTLRKKAEAAAIRQKSAWLRRDLQLGSHFQQIRPAKPFVRPVHTSQEARHY